MGRCVCERCDPRDGLVYVERWQKLFLHDSPSGICRAMCKRGSGSNTCFSTKLSWRCAAAISFLQNYFLGYFKSSYGNQKKLRFATHLSLKKCVSQNWPDRMLRCVLAKNSAAWESHKVTFQVVRPVPVFRRARSVCLSSCWTMLVRALMCTARPDGHPEPFLSC